jgi:subtilase family serine protease
MSYSYGECELFLGTGGNAFYNTLWQQAAAQGITVLVSSGDSGSAGCDNNGTDGATGGIAINGLGSTQYNLAVGGTDF